MEMAKYLALIVAVVATLVVVDAAQARGRRGGCPGGNCYVAGSDKLATADQAPAPLAAEATEAAPTVIATAPAAAPRYTNNVRRGWFARRRS